MFQAALQMPLNAYVTLRRVGICLFGCPSGYKSTQLCCSVWLFFEFKLNLKFSKVPSGNAISA
jgi:hypothetical protein